MVLWRQAPLVPHTIAQTFCSVKSGFAMDRVGWSRACRDAVGAVLSQHVKGD
jgi:hypothetical protein